MTCKDCVHYDVCDALEEGNGLAKVDADICGCFKDKSRFVELPCDDVVKHGKWIYKYKGTDCDDIAYCSLCNFYAEDKINNIGLCYHYCPNCGARMGGESE